MYLDELAAQIRAHIPEDRMPPGEAEDLLRIYAVLLRAKGADVTLSDIHDAWSAWMAKRDGKHESLVSYENLSTEVQQQDHVFVTAVRRAAEESGRLRASRPSFGDILFPSGPPQSEADTRQARSLQDHG